MGTSTNLTQSHKTVYLCNGLLIRKAMMNNGMKEAKGDIILQKREFNVKIIIQTILHIYTSFAL